ncbi:MAG: family 78 glycoside hydrolase catalytic domain [Tepidisphaeraceae bacterium]
MRNRLLLSLILLSVAIPASAGVEVLDLRCEYAADPFGVDVPQPRLYWRLDSDERGQKQTAWRILVASSPEQLAKDTGDLWDSGKVVSDQTIHIPYAGKALGSSQQVVWKVRAWDAAGKESAWSKPATWTMGILADADWKARWISAKGAAANPVARTFVGYHAAESAREDDAKWVQVDLGRDLPIDTIRLHPVRHDDKDGFGYPIRFKLEVSADADFAKPAAIVDRTTEDVANPGYSAVSFDARAVRARYVRVTATKLAKPTRSYCFALAQLEVLSGGNNVALNARVTAKDTVEAFGWGKAALTDGRGMVGAELPKGPAYDTMLLRGNFTVRPGLKRAIAHVCGLGQYEMTINGAKSGEDLLSPGWTKYDKTCLYDTHEITALLKEGPNAIGLLLGNGMYNVKGGRYTKFKGTFGPLKAIAQLRLEYADGTVETIATGDGWKVAPGPITFSCIYGGEDYNARLDPRGWDKPGFDDYEWQPAIAVDGPGGKLRGFTAAAPPLRAIETIKVARITELRPGVAVYDLGQNAPIMPRLKVKGPAGSFVRIIPAELVNADGAVDRGSAGGGASYWQYKLLGIGSEQWFPKFFYHGCRYLQVELNPTTPGGALPTVESLEGVVVHTASRPVGEFACSNEMFTRIRTLIRWAQRSNLVSVITDCPHRERLGWLEQYHLNGPALRYEFDLARLFTKGTIDMADSQLENGLVPDIAPEYTVFSGGFRDSPEWGSAMVLVPWQQYEWTGDVELLRRHYDGMKRYVAYLGSKSRDGIVSHGLGDWYDIGPKPPGYSQLTPIPLTATAFYYQDAIIVAQAAKLLGNAGDAEKYGGLAAQIRTAFNKAFYTPDKKQYAIGSQCGNSLALVMGLAEPDARAGVLEGIVQDVRRRGNSLTAGDVGYRYLLRALADGGRSDVIFDINSRSDKPGYGWQLAMGATSLTEAWDAGRGSSQNHFMLGQITEWFYHDLAGIACDPGGPGFKRIVIHPQPVGDVTWARAKYDSIRGPIVSDWKLAGGKFALDVTIPANTTATVWIPAKNSAAVTEGGKSLAEHPEIKVLRMESGCVVMEVESGKYAFVVH